MTVRFSRIIYVLLLLGVIVSGFSLYRVTLSMQLATDLARAQHRGDVVWDTLQYKTELSSLISALQSWLLAKNKPSSAEIIDRLDVLWSRLESTGQGVIGKQVAQLVTAQNTVDNTLALLKEYEPIVLTLNHANTQDIYQFLFQLKQFEQQFNVISNIANTKINHMQVAMHQQLNEGFLQIFIFSASILVLGLLILLLLRFEKSKVDKLRNNLEKYVIDLETAQDELIKSERLSTIGLLVGSVSHELRNPICTIQNACAVLKRCFPITNQRTDKALQRIELSSHRCNHFIDELLDYTRQRQLNLEQTDVDPWIERVISEIKIPANASLSFDLRSDANIWLDKERMRQVIVNLINNAWQSLTDSNNILVKEKIKVCSEVVDQRLLIHVSDTGPGIAERDQESIFEPLYSTRESGVGLGLFLVRQIIEHHGGRIQLNSEVGLGSTFTLLLPLTNNSH